MTRRAVLAIPIVALVVVACAQAATPTGSLKVTYWPHGRSQAATHWTLRCGPAGGTHPAAARSCAQAKAHAVDLGPATKPCTIMQTRYSAQALVTGTWAGRRVDRAYRIGCPGWSALRLVLTGH
jgi:hypothetical protein